MNKIDKAREILKKYNQNHIKNIDEKLADQILKIDFEQLQELYEQANSKTLESDIDNIEPVKAINPNKISKEEIENYIKIGEENVRAGKFAVAIMAGGQGTRLGHNGPKGTFTLTLNLEQKSLFQIIIEKLQTAQKQYNIKLPCYIMTSPENNDDTVKFFEKNNYFGYQKEYIKFFEQGEQPLLDKDGKVLIGEDGLIKLASDGNGGIFCSMAKNGIIDDMKKKSIEWVFIGSVDNLLVKYVDTLLLGIAISQNVKIATKTIIKNSPYEKVGVLCKRNGKVKVIEYTEIPKKMRFAVDECGEMIYGESHIMCNLFNIQAIEKASTKELQYHIAVKKSKYMNEDGEIIEPTEENCYKFEKFIFDSFCLFDKIAILRGKREEDFAPIKNESGPDSPETAKKMYEEYIKRNV